MPCAHEIRCRRMRIAKFFALISKDLECELRIEKWIVALHALQLTVLVVLYQVVIRIAWKRQRVQAQRVDNRKLQEAKVWVRGGEVRQIERNDVVADEKRGAIRQLVELPERSGEIATGERERFICIAADSGKAVNEGVVATNF